MHLCQEASVRVSDHERNKKIAEAYSSGQYLTEHIARAFGLSRRRVQEIAREQGVVRTRAEANRVASPLKSKRRIRL